MKTLKRAVHLDFHTMPKIPDFGANFDAKRFVETLKEARVEFINTFAKCNIGFAYYPTKVGIPHPYLKFDLLGQIVEECHKAGIGVSAYFNIGLDHEMARRRRDWCVLNKDGQVIWGDRTGNFFRLMCLNSGYRDYMLAMIREVVENYPVDGVFLDCLVYNPCYGNECAERMAERGLDPLDDEAVARHTRESVIDFCREVKKIVGDDKLLLPNGLPHVDREGIATHVEIECLPGAWGYDYFAAQAAYTRNLGKPVIYMSGRFHASWGDFGGLKQKASLEYDAWDAISNGMSLSVGDHMHPRDGLEPATYRMIGDVFKQLERLEPWTDGAKAAAEIAVIYPEGSDFGGNNVRFRQGQTVLYAAARMLGELKYTFDIVEPKMDLSKYRVILLPDVVTVTPELKRKLQDHLAKGGGIVSTGYSGLNPEKTAFALPEWNARFDGFDSDNISYFKAEGEAAKAFPDRLCAIYHPSVLLHAEAGAETVAAAYKAYFSKHWDGFHGYFYTPPEKPAGRPAVVRSGNIFQFSFALFTGYFEYAMPEHKYLLKYCLEQLLDDPIVRAENLPSTSRVTVTAKDGMSMIHVKVTYPELRGKYNVIEEHNEWSGGAVWFRADAVKAVYTAPDRTPLAYERQGAYIRIPLPKIVGYVMVVVEH